MSRREVRSLAAALCLVGLLSAGCSDDGEASTTTTAPGSGSDDGSTSSTDPSSSDGGDSGVTDGTAEPGATDSPSVDLEPLPPVAVGQPADFGDGLFATVTEVDSVQLEARAPGEIGGPGILVTLELRNDTDEAVDLTGIAVNATYGEGTPATPHMTGPVSPVSGMLDPGERATGTYAFRVPEDQMGSAVIDVHHSAEVNFVIVEVGGAVG